MGIDTKRSKTTVLWRHRPSSVCLLAPNACPQIGSIPMDSPDRTEYPVMLANPSARDPPARAIPPRRPRNSMDIIERQYRKSPVSIIGMAIPEMDRNSLTARERWVSFPRVPSKARTKGARHSFRHSGSLYSSLKGGGG
ncbi:hypothetical protein MLD38_029128 [Melastoma candidum]|uniref:Uncharacterized protein n=1 Tax=Melastoma candidum TaxID=119954 RepID=A0ACB9N3Y3_9MYRT|nr:hypothetical protein MLD38_029128 [Melastoma candidum]